jgi:hypothetical protein
VRAPLLTIGGLALATAALHVRDPHERGSWGLCPSRAVLGIDCPGCGGLRAVNDLTHLRLEDALSSNLLVVLGIPVAVVLLALWTWDRWRGVRAERVPPPVRRGLLYAVVAAALVFMLVRNLPGSWLAA